MTNKSYKKVKNIKAYLISRLVVSFLAILAAYLLVVEHYPKAENSNLSLSIVIVSIVAVIVTTGITLHAFWSHFKSEKNT